MKKPQKHDDESELCFCLWLYITCVFTEGFSSKVFSGIKLKKKNLTYRKQKILKKIMLLFTKKSYNFHFTLQPFF